MQDTKNIFYTQEKRVRKNIFSSSRLEKIFFRGHKGFTIIEILVVLSVIVILSSVGFASLLFYGRREAVNQAAQGLKSAVLTARFNAISAVRPSSSCTVLKGYKILIFTSDNSYSIHRVCDSGESGVYRNKLSPGFSFSSVPCSQIYFATLSGSASCVSGSLPANIVIRGEAGITKTVRIDLNGNASIQ
jgi:prepilin-type N-terminal cleavage/methylation domain-containing protein